MQEIQHFFKEPNVTGQNLAKFCRSVFEVESSQYCFNTQLKIRSFPISQNGVLTVKKDGSYIVNINLYQLIIDKDCSDKMKFFRLYTTVLHEIEHIKLISSLKDTVPTDFQSAMAMAEYIPRMRSYNNRYVYSQLFSPDFRKMLQYRYNVSLSEQISIYCSFSTAYQRLSGFLTEDERIPLELTIKELKLIKNNLELCYLSKMMPANRFMHFLKLSMELLREHKLFVEDYPILKCFFDERGKLRELCDFYYESKKGAAFNSIATQTLIRLFIYQGKHFNELFETEPDSITYMESVVNEYIKDSISFIKESKKFTIFFNQKVLEDNVAVIMHNIRMLNEQMREYGMNQQSGTIFPLYKYMN